MSYLNWTALIAPMYFLLFGSRGAYALCISLGVAFVVEFVFRFCAGIRKALKDE